MFIHHNLIYFPNANVPTSFREISWKLRAISRRNLVVDWRRCWLIRVAEVKGSLGRAPLCHDRKLCPCIQVRQNGLNPSVPLMIPLLRTCSSVPDTGKDKNIFEGFSNRRLPHTTSADCIWDRSHSPASLSLSYVPHVRNKRPIKTSQTFPLLHL